METPFFKSGIFFWTVTIIVESLGFSENKTVEGWEGQQQTVWHWENNSIQFYDKFICILLNKMC